jgi:putative phosphoesterase
MKIALLADIHANLPALETAIAYVDELRPDAVIVAGDVINRGPRPLECLDAILDRQASFGWLVFRGNHEDYVLKEACCTEERPPWMKILCQHTLWTHDRVRHRLEAIRAWPDRIEFTGPGGQRVRVVHGSMHGNRAGLYEHMEDDLLHDMIAPAPAVLGAGHTHIPFVKRVRNTVIVNAGAVGLPFDSDRRASLAVVELTTDGASARVVRLPYDWARAERDFQETGYLEEGGLMAQLILEELQTARARIGLWHHHYEQAVAAGRMSIEESVRELLQR